MERGLSRLSETQSFLNPAFCGVLLYRFIATYSKEKKGAVPVSLVFLVLPLVLNEETRSSINSRASFPNWARQHRSSLLRFPERAGSLLRATSEAVEFLTSSALIGLNSDGELEVTGRLAFGKAEGEWLGSEVRDCINKCEHVARWFFRAGSPAIVFYTLGVCP